jgi:tRNA (pseudouridine54-N1)-methyltransferase
MISFVIVGHQARTDGSFSLNDLPGAGRMDVLCRAVNAAFFLSHDLRRDVTCYLVLYGEPAPPKTIKFDGSTIRSLSPDERSAGALIKKALSTMCGGEFREAGAGLWVRKSGLARLATELPVAVLDENGTDIRSAPTLPDAFLLSDHENFTTEEEALISTCPRYSVGPKCLHADHTITVLTNELDRRSSGWK